MIGCLVVLGGQLGHQLRDVAKHVRDRNHGIPRPRCELEHAEQGEHALSVVSPPSAMIGSLTAPVEGPRCTEALRPKRIC
jgi:hypothetical protein